jgi:DNA-binding transcriptional MerR regulator
MHSTYTIGDLAQEFGVTLRTLRFYEDKQLLSPSRRGAKRLYSRRDRERLKMVLLGRKVGFSLAEIRDLLDVYSLKACHAADLEAALTRFERQLIELRERKAHMEQAIGELTRTVHLVSGMLRAREGARPVLEAAE